MTRFSENVSPLNYAQLSELWALKCSSFALIGWDHTVLVVVPLTLRLHEQQEAPPAERRSSKSNQPQHRRQQQRENATTHDTRFEQVPYLYIDTRSPTLVN